MSEINQETAAIKKPKLEPSFDNLENSIKLWWKNIKSFLKIYLEALLYPAIAFILSAVFTLLSYYVSALETMAVFFFVIAIILSIYFFTRASLAIVFFIDRDYQGNSKSLFDETKPLFWPYIGLAILSTILIILWTLLLIIPGIVYSIFYSFAIFVFLLENKKGMSALKRSKEIVKGYFWPVFGRTLLVGIVISIVMGILSTPIKFFPEGSVMFTTMNTVLNIIAFILAPISTIFTYRMYKDLLKIKESK